MLTKPICLHSPPLYEERTAQISWESVDDVQEYELDCHFDEDFKTALTGKSWQDMDEAGLPWFEIEARGLSWTEFEALPAQGLTWSYLEFLGHVWDELEAKNMSWLNFQRLAPGFTVYKGAGEKTQGPDQGLTWGNVDSAGLTWAQLEALGWTWEDFMFRPSIGLTWAQLESEGLTWTGIEAVGYSWYALEHRAPKGLCWGSLDGQYLTWTEIEAKGLPWAEFESLPPDDDTHIAHAVEIPLYKKKAIFRVRACRDGVYSDYLTSALMPILPVFYRDDSISFAVTKDQEYFVQLHARDIERFSKIIMTLEYDPAVLKLEDFAGQTQYGIAASRISPAMPQIVSSENGKLRFQCTRSVPPGTQLTGNVSVLKFVAARSGNAQVKLY